MCAQYNRHTMNAPRLNSFVVIVLLVVGVPLSSVSVDGHFFSGGITNQPTVLSHDGLGRGRCPSSSGGGHSSSRRRSSAPSSSVGRCSSDGEGRCSSSLLSKLQVLPVVREIQADVRGGTTVAAHVVKTMTARRMETLK